MEGHTVIVNTHANTSGTHGGGETQMEISIINNGDVTNIVDGSGNSLSRQEDDVIAVLGQLFESAEDTLQQMAQAAQQMDTRQPVSEDLKSREERQRPFVCECGKSYTCKSHLKYHQKVHNNIRPYICEVCNLSFLQLGHLRRHSRIHTLDKPYKCDVCDKAFRQSSHLTCHRRIHTNEKPYECHVCGQGFRQKSAVCRHVQRMHIKEKVYICSLCDKGYSGESDLRRHEKTHVNITYFAVMNLQTNSSKICGHIQEDINVVVQKKQMTPQENKENNEVKKQINSQIIDKTNKQSVNTTNKQMINIGNKQTANRQPIDNENTAAKQTTTANQEGFPVPLVQTDELRPFRCDLCGKSYKTKGHLKFHFKVHQSDRPFKCPFCAKGFLQKGHLRRHILVHTDEKPYVCTDCDKVFRQVGHLNDHKKIHANLRPCICNICSRGFRQTSALKRHIVRMHGTPNVYTCNSCEKSYRLESDLKRHQATTCNKDKPKTKRTRRAPKTRRSKVAHKRKTLDHVEDDGSSDSSESTPKKSSKHPAKRLLPRKVYQCEICDKPCASKADCKIHMRIHNGEKPFQCGICHNIFRQLAHLKHHMLIHTGERPFVCKQCNKSFRKNSALNRHVGRMHAKEKKYECGICPKTFASVADIKRHRKSHMKENGGLSIPKRKHDKQKTPPKEDGMQEGAVIAEEAVEQMQLEVVPELQNEMDSEDQANVELDDQLVELNETITSAMEGQRVNGSGVEEGVHAEQGGTALDIVIQDEPGSVASDAAYIQEAQPAEQD